MNSIETVRQQTLNVIMLNKDTFPPDADMTYESFFDKAMHAADSSGGLLSLVSLVMRVPLVGCHNCGTTYALD